MRSRQAKEGLQYPSLNLRGAHAKNLDLGVMEACILSAAKSAITQPHTKKAD